MSIVARKKIELIIEILYFLVIPPAKIRVLAASTTTLAVGSATLVNSSMKRVWG